MSENLATEEKEIEIEEKEKEVESPVGEDSKPIEGEKEKPKDNRYSRRVKELNTKWRESERKAAELQRMLDERVEATKIIKEPDPDEFDDLDKYKETKNKWNEQERARIRREEREAIKQEELDKKHKENLEAGKNAYIKSRASYVKEIPDFHKFEVEIDEAVEQWQAPEIQNIILESKELGPAIVKHFGENPDDLLDIASSSPAKRFFKMGQLITKLQAKPVKKSSSAPDPIRSEKGSATKSLSSDAPYDPKRETFQEYARRRNGL